MADFDSIKAGFGDFMGNVFDKAKEVGGVAKVQALIKAEEAKKQDGYYKLGKKYYELYKDAPASDLSEIMDKLLASDAKIAEYKEELAKMDEEKAVYKACKEACEAEEEDFAEEVSDVEDETDSTIE